MIMEGNSIFPKHTQGRGGERSRSSFKVHDCGLSTLSEYLFVLQQQLDQRLLE